jgi:hypothetical protein
MPRHPPYTLSSLTTFIDHRHVESQGLPSSALGELTFARTKAVFLIHLTGRVKRFPYLPCLTWVGYRRSITDRFLAKKVLDDILHSNWPTEKPKFWPADEDVAKVSIRFTNLLIKP